MELHLLFLYDLCVLGGLLNSFYVVGMLVERVALAAVRLLTQE
jgi:hypothetical protein